VAEGELWEMSVWVREWLRAWGSFYSYVKAWLPWLETSFVVCPWLAMAWRTVPRVAVNRSSVDNKEQPITDRAIPPHGMRESTQRSQVLVVLRMVDVLGEGRWRNLDRIAATVDSASTKQLGPVAPRSRIFNWSDQRWLTFLAQMFSETL